MLGGRGRSPRLETDAIQTQIVVPFCHDRCSCVVYFVGIHGRLAKKTPDIKPTSKCRAADFAFSYRNHLQFVSFNKDIASPGLPEFVRIDRLDMTGCQSDKINFHNVRNADIWHLLLRSTPRLTVL